MNWKKFIYVLLGPIFLAAASKSAENKDLQLWGTYTYWFAGEDGLGIGRSGNFLAGDDPLFNSSTTYLSQPFSYQSGFQIGMDWKKNNWNLFGNYTWVRNKTTSYSPAPLLSENIGTGVWLIAPWFVQIAQDGGSLSGTQVDSTWKLGMDIADLALSYCHALGTHLIFYPFAGLRAAWIRQSLAISLTEPIDLFLSLPSQPIDSFTGCHGWSLGPRFGTYAHLLAGNGFRFQGTIALSLLYTRYTQILHTEDAPATDTFPGPLQIQGPNQSALRSVLEAGLGVGYCTSLSKHFGIDLAASYDFMLWWDQNMLREFMNSIWNQTPTNGNLYLHGLTLTASLKF